MASSTNSDAQIQKAASIAGDHIGKSFISPGSTLDSREGPALAAGRKVRDTVVHELPILNSAIYVFQQISASREFYLAGKPRGVSRALDYMYQTETHDPYTGMVYYGFEEFEKRRVMDHICVGRSTFGATNMGESNQGALNYIDPTYLSFQRKQYRAKAQRIKPTDKIWKYTATGEEFTNREIVINHPLPFGFNRFIAPVMYALPTAILGYLVQEHDTAAVDGRKIRDIMLVSTVLEDAIKQAVQISVALHAGASAADVGVPVIPVNVMAGAKITDMFAMLGLSNIPENFDRAKFEFKLANLISAVLGLALRHFWQLESGSNRALETVQEARQQQKGPAAFNRSEQRLLNQCGLFNMFKQGTSRVRFAFIEEVDVSTKKANATVLKEYATALQLIQTVFGATISAESYLAWMQSLGVLPNEIKLDEIEAALLAVESDPSNREAGETAVNDTPDPIALEADVEVTNRTGKSAPIDYGEVMINSLGEVVDFRVKSFPISRVIAKSDPVYFSASEPVEINLFDAAIEMSRQEDKEAVITALAFYGDASYEIFAGFATSPVEEVKSLIKNMKTPNLELYPTEWSVVNDIADALRHLQGEAHGLVL